MKQNRVDVIIITPHVSQLNHVPGGMVYVDGMLEEAHLTDQLSSTTPEIAWLTECLKTLKRSFGRRIRVRLVDPMTLAGLYLVVRHRIRRFPSVITPNGQVHFQPPAAEISQIIADSFQQSQ